MDTRNLSGKAVVVTGAASGIGRATALLAARRGARVYVCDVDAEGLERTAAEARGIGAEVATAIVDVGKADHVRAFADLVHARAPAADVLVNNAGVGLAARFADTTLEDWRWIVDVNLFGVVHGCHFFVPKMVARGQGHVVNVASMAGFVATAGTLAYGTTKFAVVGLSECLHVELARHGVGVSAICPGVIDTAIVRTARARGDLDTPRARERVVDLFRRRAYPPEKVAEAIFRAVADRRTIAPVTPEAWAFYALKRAAPAAAWRIAQWVERRAEKELLR